ncbi:MAG: SDR family oxidoreductase [Gammaproteobacteria bacterium]|nr:SDR family oxidoreductase [Gammaproteobacteria bacterium]
MKVLKKLTGSEKMQQLFDLTGKRALIVGASSGIGFHCAQTLAQAGAEVVLAARREKYLQDNCQTIETSTGSKTSYYVVDVGEPQQVKQFLQQLDDDGRYIDILVNAAGTSSPNAFPEESIETWRQVVNINLNGNWQVADGIAKQMIAQKVRGSIINISSVAALHTSSRIATAYMATKAALSHTTRQMEMTLAKYAIRVNALEPGWFKTAMSSEFLQTSGGKRMVNAVPLKRVGEYHELSGPLLLLASDAGSYMTGSTINVDGGYICHGME